MEHERWPREVLHALFRHRATRDGWMTLNLISQALAFHHPDTGDVYRAIASLDRNGWIEKRRREYAPRVMEYRLAPGRTDEAVRMFPANVPLPESSD